VSLLPEKVGRSNLDKPNPGKSPLPAYGPQLGAWNDDGLRSWKARSNFVITHYLLYVINKDNNDVYAMLWSYISKYMVS
jgi:hypothetical protein